MFNNNESRFSLKARFLYFSESEPVASLSVIASQLRRFPPRIFWARLAPFGGGWRAKRVMVLIALVGLGIGGFLIYKNVFQIEAEKGIREEIKPSYKYVTEKPTGWFKTGQEADVVLYATGFNESGGPLVFNQPGKVRIVGEHLILVDTRNNRVLIWNKIPTKNDELPDLVLGQPDFDSNVAKLGPDGMNWPMGVFSDGQKLLVADTYNNRILVWKKFPTRNGQPADLVLGAPDFETHTSSYRERNPRTHLDWPWDVWTDGKKVVALSTGDGAVLIWDSFPTRNNQTPDTILGHRDFSTRFSDRNETMWYEEHPLADVGSPRSIAYDGRYFVLGGYGDSKIRVWNGFPTRSGQPADYFVYPTREEDSAYEEIFGLSIANNKLFITSSHYIFIWNEFPTDSEKEPDLRVGVSRVAEETLIAPDKMLFFPDTFGFAFGLDSNDNKLVMSASNRVFIFNKIPSKPNEKADVILGTPEIFVSRKSFTNPTPFSDGQRLLIGSDGFGVFIYNNLPDESKAEADVILGPNAIRDHLSPVGGRVTTDGKRLIMVHRDDKSSVLIWNEIPQEDNESPDIIIGRKKRIGRDGLHGAIGVATDGKSLFVTDTGNNRVLIWNEIPTKSQTPADFVLGQPDFKTNEPGNAPDNFNYPVGINSDGKHLAVADMENQRILIWELPIVENGQMPDLILREMKLKDREEPMTFNLPQDVVLYGDKLFVADGGFHRVLIWSKFPETENTPPDIVLGQKDFFGSSSSNDRDRLFVPVSISFDGSFLWVGEAKWSNRLLRFSVQP